MASKPATPAQTTTTPAGFSSRETLRANARKKIEDGAITDTCIGDRETLIKLLNDALATEYVCALRYYRRYQAVEKQPDDAAKDGRDDESSAQALDSSGASPGLYRTGEMKNDLDDRFSTTCQGHRA
jgi:hypothetical protein